MYPTRQAEQVAERVLYLARQIQQVPAPTFKERKRARLVRGLFESEGLANISIDALNNVYARLPGRSNTNPLVVSAHLDTVFSTRTPAIAVEDGRIHGPGIGDNALGVAGLFGLIWMSREAGALLESDVWLAANSCEEGLGDLRGMRAVVNRFGRGARGYLVLEGTALAQVYHRAVGVQRYRVRVTTTGGHSWSDYGNPSAVHEVAQIVSELSSLPLPLKPRTTLNVGTISGGSGVNVLASEAQFELDVRSEGSEQLEALTATVEEVVEKRRRDGIHADCEIIGRRPAGGLPIDHAWVKLALECIGELGLTGRPTSGSTDANIPLSLGLAAVVLGITTGGGAHTPQEYIDTAPVRHGLQQIYCFVRRLLGTA